MCSSGRLPERQTAPALPRAAAEPVVHQTVPVGVATVKERDFPVYLTGLGSVQAFNTVSLKSRVDGQIMQVNFQEGQDVRKGELLIVIDERPYQVALATAQANLQRDEAQLANAKAQYERNKALYESGVIAKQDLDTLQASFGQFEGTIAADKAAIDNAKLNLTYCRITSPIDGRVGLRQVDPGNYITAASGTPMLVITQLHPIAVIFTLPEDQLQSVLQQMRKGAMQVDVYGRDDQTKLSAGKLLTIDNQIDRDDGNGEAESDLRESGKHALAERVCERPSAAGNAQGRDNGSGCSRAARSAGYLHLRRRSGQHRQDAAGANRSYPGQHGGHCLRIAGRRPRCHRWTGEVAGRQ